MPFDNNLSISPATTTPGPARTSIRPTSLLARGLEIELPINKYPTTYSLAAAPKSLGSMARKVDLVSEMSAGDEAMLLYDMDVEGLGSMRVAEHFTAEDGKIARIGQIHDTAALRAAGFAEQRKRLLSGGAADDDSAVEGLDARS
jgi:hypothetical protein